MIQAADEDDPISKLLAEEFGVIGRIASGGQAHVYLVVRPGNGWQTAVKVMKLEYVSDKTREQFHREALNTARLQNEHVVRVNSLGAIDGVPYLEMEYVKGKTLAAILLKGPLEPKTCVSIVEQVAAVLSEAQSLGLVHRDLKPSNIMVTPAYRNENFVKVLDFGIAKIPEDPTQAVTTDGLPRGTFEYMSPEEGVDARSDVYSLGVIAFEMLTGRLPTNGKDRTETIAQSRSGKLLRLDQAAPSKRWTRELQKVMDKAFSLDVNRRYQDAETFARDLGNAVTQWAESHVGSRPAHPRIADQVKRLLRAHETTCRSLGDALSVLNQPCDSDDSLTWAGALLADVSESTAETLDCLIWVTPELAPEPGADVAAARQTKTGRMHPLALRLSDLQQVLALHHPMLGDAAAWDTYVTAERMFPLSDLIRSARARLVPSPEYYLVASSSDSANALRSLRDQRLYHLGRAAILHEEELQEGVTQFVLHHKSLGGDGLSVADLSGPDRSFRAFVDWQAKYTADYVYTGYEFRDDVDTNFWAAFKPSVSPPAIRSVADFGRYLHSDLLELFRRAVVPLKT